MYTIEKIKKQEENLKFDLFNHKVALEFGEFVVKSAKIKKLNIAVSIFLDSDCPIFQYFFEGTNLLNKKWIERKYNTVKTMQRSSLLSMLKFEENQETLENHGLKNEKYALCGGGFPIRIKSSDLIVGVIVISNMHHLKDHSFIVECLNKFIESKNV
ncbi:MAG: heme-binding protein [Fusobacteriaceae bacterium]